MSASRWCHIDADEIAAETEAAFLFVIDGEEHWIPKSQMSEPDRYAKGDTNASVSITQWIADQKGL